MKIILDAVETKSWIPWIRKRTQNSLQVDKNMFVILDGTLKVQVRSLK